MATNSNNKKISQLPVDTTLDGSSLIPIAISGANYSIALSAITNFVQPSILDQTLSGYTTGTNQQLTSSDTILTGFENTQAQINAKQDAISPYFNNGKVLYSDGNNLTWNTRMAVRDSGDTEEIAFIEIEEVTGNINISSVFTGASSINLISSDTVSISDDGLIFQNDVSGKTATFALDYGFELSSDINIGIYSDDDNGLHLRNTNIIYVPTPTLTADTMALLTDIGVEPTYSIDLSINNYTISGSGIYEIVSGSTGNTISFSNPALINGRSITLINSTPDSVLFDNSNTYAPYIQGSTTQSNQIGGEQYAIYKSINGKLRGGYLSS